MKKEKEQHFKYDPSISLKKADDWTRRAFIQRASMFLGAFGVPWLVRLEVMEKVSKRLFGSSIAFAQGKPVKYRINVHLRSGYQIDKILGCTKSDATAGGVPAFRNIHFGPDTGVTIPAATTGGRDLYVSPQMQTLATNFPTRMAFLTSGSSLNGHTNRPLHSWLDGSGHFMNHLAAESAASTRPPLLSNTFVYGQDNDYTLQDMGSLTGDFSPIYFNSSDEVRALFQPFSLKPSDGTTVGQDFSKQIFSVINSEFNTKFLSLIQKRPGGASIGANVQKMQDLLSRNLTAELTPDAAEITALSTGVTTPGNGQQQLRTVLGSAAADLAEVFSMAGRLFSKGITQTFTVTLNTGDWHGFNTHFTNGNAGDGIVQGIHAACWANLMNNVLTAYDAGGTGALGQFTDADGIPIGQRTQIVFSSEFTRDSVMGNNGTDNGDQDVNGFWFIAPSSMIVAGTYGNVDSTGQHILPDLTTGADSTAGKLDRATQFTTIAKFFGLDLAEIGVSSANRDKYLKALIKG